MLSSFFAITMHGYVHIKPLGPQSQKASKPPFAKKTTTTKEARQKKAMLYIGFYFSSSSSTLFLVPTSSYCSSAYGEAVRRNFLHSMRVLLNIGTSGIGAKYIG